MDDGGHQHRAGRPRASPALVLAVVSLLVTLGLIGQVLRDGPARGGLEEGSPISVSSRVLDFGLLPVHGEAVRELVLRNDGGDPVEAELSVASSTYAVHPRRLSLAPGVAASVAVAVRAERPGQLHDELLIRLENASAVVVRLEGLVHGDAVGEEPAEDGRTPLELVRRKAQASSDQG